MTTLAYQIPQNHSENHSKYIFKEKKENFIKTDFKMLHQNPIAGMILNYVLCQKDENFLFDVDAYSQYSDHNPKTIRKNINILIDLGHCIMIKTPGMHTEYYFSRYRFTEYEKNIITHTELSHTELSHTKKVNMHGSRHNTDSNTQLPDNVRSFPQTKKRRMASSSNSSNYNYQTTTTLQSNSSSETAIDPKQKTQKQNSVNTTNVVGNTRENVVGQTKSIGTKSCVKQDVVVEKNIKNKNSLVDFGTQLRDLESHKTETPIKSKPVCRTKENSPRPVKRVIIKPTPKKNQSPYPEKNPSKDRRPETNPEDKKILSNRNQAIRQVPIDLQKRLSEDDKVKIWNVLGDMQDKIPVDELAQRLIHSILNSKPGKDGQSRFAGHFYSSCANRYQIPKQKTHSEVESEKELEIRRTRIPVYTPPKPLTEKQKNEANEFLSKSNLSHNLRCKLSENPIKPNREYMLRNSYWHRKNRPELSEKETR